MRARIMTPNQRKACRHEANREKRQELARLRDQASLDKAGERGRRYKVANRESLKGKGLFYCDSPLEREKEIQRRRHEAKRENR